MTAWNGLMISAFARAAQVLNDPRYLDAAKKAADFIQQKLYRAETNTLLRSYREGASDVNGFASDYAFLIQGLLDLYEVSFDIARIEWALKLQQRQNELFADAKQGGYFDTSGRDTTVLLRMKQADDMAEPSANAISALNLLRLGNMLDQSDARDHARRTIDAFGKQLDAEPASMPQMLIALSWSRGKPKQVVIAGKPGAAATDTMLREVHRHFVPHELLILADGGPGQQFFADRIEFMKTVTQIENMPTAYVCENFACQLPTTNVAQLANLLVPGTAKPAK